MCACTRRRISAIRRWASFDSSWVNANDVAPCAIVAATTMPTKGSNFSISRFPMTSSISHLVEAGSTSPVTRFTIINRKPSPSMFRRGSTSDQISGQTLVSDGAGLFSAGFDGGTTEAGAAADIPSPR